MSKAPRVKSVIAFVKVVDAGILAVNGRSWGVDVHPLLRRAKKDYVVEYRLNRKGALRVLAPGGDWIPISVFRRGFSVPTCFLPQEWIGKKVDRIRHSSIIKIER